MAEERRPWDRRQGESNKAHEAFRAFRDIGPRRQLPGSRQARRWSAQWDWHARATAWDDELRMVEDAERIEAIRSMHRTHQRAGKAAIGIALRALQQLQPDGLSAAEVVRLLDIGTRLERAGLTSQVDDPSEVVEVPGEDPWERIARELSGT